jgi:ectoine hydroxylase-related dioxygenase (phytanoyl-CoA dioxygenase family)
MPCAEELDLERDGVCLRVGLAVPAIDALVHLLSDCSEERAGVRLTQRPDFSESLGSGGVIGQAATSVLGEGCFPVRAVLFDKSDKVNWSLGWHQDRTVAVLSRHEVSGFGPWSIKQGIQHVEPPFDLIESMVTVRVHLDPVDEHNAPLLVALGSHRLGKLSVADVEAVAARTMVFACLAEWGDVWVYRTPIIHASRAASPGRRRRVLQIDYAAQSLPHGLRWLGI